MRDKKEYEALFELGVEDLKLVEKNLGDPEIRPQLLLFHLQQAVEKFLKSVLSFHGIKYPKVHDIEELIELCEENNIILPSYIESLIDLTPYAVEFRYGLMIEELLDLRHYYELVRGFKEFVQDFFKKGENL
ncbi:MAG: HEPN domain-containing protein [Thermodesulfovibrionales bacterium]